MSTQAVTGNYDLDKEQNKVTLFINAKIFPLALVKKTSASFSEKAWVSIDGDPGEELLVELKPQGSESLEALARSFNTKLVELSTENLEVDADDKTLVSQIKTLVKNFSADERGRTSLQSMAVLGSILAGIGLVGISAEEVSASHYCNTGGGGGGGGEGCSSGSGDTATGGPTACSECMGGCIGGGDGGGGSGGCGGCGCCDGGCCP